jgi:hypothetical protein
MKSFTKSYYKYIVFFTIVPILTLLLIYPDNVLQFLEIKIWWVTLCLVWFLSTNTDNNLKHFNYKLVQSIFYFVHFTALSIMLFKYYSNHYPLTDMNYFEYKFSKIFAILDIYFFFTFFGMIAGVESELFNASPPKDNSKEILDKFVNRYKKK